MKKITFLITALTLFIYAYAQNTLITGTITQGDYKNVAILQATTEKEIANAKIENKKFTIKFDLSQNDLFFIVFDDKDYFILDIKPNEKINLQVNFKDFNQTEVSGSPSSEYYLRNNKIITKYRNNEELKQQKLDSILNSGEYHLSSLIFAYNLDKAKYKETHKIVKEKLKNYENHDFYQQYMSLFKTEIGSEAMEIELPDQNGKIVKLSSTRGKYVLLDFWAGWCKPCRNESPFLVAAYKKYSPKGFTIYSVSLDYTRDLWLKAIKDDGLSDWIHVSDVKGWQSEAAKKYNITSIPANFLLDPKGIIIAKNLRGNALEAKLREVLK